MKKINHASTVPPVANPGGVVEASPGPLGPVVVDSAPDTAPTSTEPANVPPAQPETVSPAPLSSTPGSIAPEPPRGRGRPRGPAKPRALNPARDAAKTTAPVDHYRAAAESTVITMESIAVGMVSPEWKFRDDSEKLMIVDALEKYMRASGIPDLPPGVVLIISLAVYAVPRLSMPITKEKIAALRGKIKT